MPTTTIEAQPSAWNKQEKLIFRFFFIYFLIQSLPLDINFFKTIFSINWLHISYGDIFTLTHFSPRFFPGADSFANWAVVLAIAVVGTIIWNKKETKPLNYDLLYYWIRTIARYRLAIGVIGYGIIKLFPLQAPDPSISNLNTNYGDFNAWKIFSLSLGVVPSYESFLGGVEIVAGLLLFFRRTASIGALFILVFTGNVFISNLAYEGGEYVYSFYLISLALFILFFDVRRIYNLVSLEKPTAPNRFVPYRYFTKVQKYARLLLKSFIILFFVFIYGFKTSSGYRTDPYQFPVTPGLAKASGIYNVSEFRINNKILPYSATDPVRWEDVVFEKWATISVRSNRPVIPDSSNYERINKEDAERDYELAGSGGRHYYSYKADTVNHTLLLENKNKHYKGERLELKYERPDSATIILSGIDYNRDSVYVVLNKINKIYLLKEGRRGPRKL